MDPWREKAETMVGDMFDAVVNPFSAALMKVERLAADRPDDLDLRASVELLKRAAAQFILYRHRWQDHRDK